MLVKKKKQDTKKDAFPLPNLTENKKYEESKNQLNNNAPNPNIVRAPDMKKNPFDNKVVQPPIDNSSNQLNKNFPMPQPLNKNKSPNSNIDNRPNSSGKKVLNEEITQTNESNVTSSSSVQLSKDEQYVNDGFESFVKRYVSGETNQKKAR